MDGNMLANKIIENLKIYTRNDGDGRYIGTTFSNKFITAISQAFINHMKYFARVSFNQGNINLLTSVPNSPVTGMMAGGKITTIGHEDDLANKIIENLKIYTLNDGDGRYIGTTFSNIFIQVISRIILHYLKKTIGIVFDVDAFKNLKVGILGGSLVGGLGGGKIASIGGTTNLVDTINKYLERETGNHGDSEYIGTTFSNKFIQAISSGVIDHVQKTANIQFSTEVLNYLKAADKPAKPVIVLNNLTGGRIF